MLGTLFTLGYQLRQPDEFVAELVRAGVDVVVDVRETAWSHRRGFSGHALRGALAERGIGYEHARFAGNPKALRQHAATHRDCLTAYAAHLEAEPDVLRRFDTLVAGLLGSGRSACLVCYERHPDDCHRSILARAWAATVEHATRVVHLGPDGAPRFIEGRVDLGAFSFTLGLFGADEP